MVTVYAKNNTFSDSIPLGLIADDYALDFYQATGGNAERVVHFNYPLNFR
jgi:aminoglycoside 3-N-acetyltransferase I